MSDKHEEGTQGEAEEAEIFTLVDDESGEEFEVMELAVLTIDEKDYSVCAPVDQLNQEDVEIELIVLAIKDGERVSIEDEAEAQMVFELAHEALMTDDEE
jgi:hypothetical protein